MAELADALDLGSSTQKVWGFESPLSHKSHHKNKTEEHLEVQVTQPSGYQQEIEVTLSYDEILPEIQQAYKDEAKKLTIDGFRKGKAPMGMIKKLYGEAIEYKASEDISSKKFWDAVEQEGLKPISKPELLDINFVPGEKLYFKVGYEIKPKIELKDYTGIEVEKPIFKFEAADVDKEIDFMLKPHCKFEETELVADNQHRITVDLQRMDEQGMPMVGSRSENIQIDLSDAKVNPQIKENAIGKKVGEEFDFVFTDEHYRGEELHKEEFKYQADLIRVEKVVKPELTEELIKKISRNKASNIDELKEYVTKNFEDYYTKQTEEIVTNNLLDIVVKNNDFTAPQGYVKTLQKRMVDSERENAKRYKATNFDEAAVSEYLKPRAEWNAKWQIIMEALAEKENIKVEESELEELAKKESEKTGITVAKLMKYYEDTSRAEMLLEEKVIRFLIDNAKITEIDAAEKMKVKKGHKHEH
ncbi:MAG: trigger factor [Ignavibacteria bacterium]|nr:MAG: trigger factor [Ignavibacteria bacterium]KAF0161399.1 MAG: trigger factor [Ignavibacteria bacterium]